MIESSQLLAALECAADSVEITGLDAKIIYVNRAFENQTGFSRDEIIGKTPGEVLRPDVDQSQIYREAWETISGGEQWNGRFSRKKKTGEIIVVDVTISPSFGAEGEIQNYVAVSRDVTEELRESKAETERLTQLVEERTRELKTSVQREKQALELEKSANVELAKTLKVRENFLANMSHELRTPLNSVLGLGEVLFEGVYGPLSEQQSSVVQTIVKSGHQLLELINDILDLSKIGSEDEDLSDSEISLGQLCPVSVQMLRERAHAKGLDLNLNLPERDYVIYANARRMKQVLSNVIRNSIKFTESGGTITLEAGCDPADGSIYFRVIDTGIGIANEHLEEIFLPFTQLQSDLNREFEGTGLGLALAQRIVASHQGTIAVESEVGKGTTMTVKLPSRRCRPSDQEKREDALGPTVVRTDSWISDAE